MDKLNTYRPYIILSIFLLTATILSIVFSTNGLRLLVETPETLNEDWLLVQDASTMLIDELPVMLDIPANTPYTVKTTLSEDFFNMEVIMIRTSLQDVTVKIDGVVIYEKTYQTESQLPPYASMWHLIELPGHSEGKEISITYSSPYDAMSGTVNEVHYGSTASLYAHLFRTYGYRLMVGIFVLIVGLIMMFASLLVKKGEGLRYTYIGLFSTLLSFWILAESRLLQLFTGNEFILGSLAYLSLAIFPIPLLYYLKSNIIRVYKKSYQVFIGIFYTQSVLITVFHAFDIADYFESVIYTQVFLVAGMVMILTTLALEIYKHQNKDALRITKYFIFILIFLLIELINFLLGNFEDTSVFALTGIGLSMLFMLINYIRYLISRMKLSYEKEFYERLAYHDWMTGGMNRLKFERDFEIYFSDPVLKKKLRLIYFDFDDLKKVNDVHGHLEGDKVIRRGFEIIESIFKDVGSCYRIGGDEFACLVLDTNDEMYQIKVKKLRTDIDMFSKELNYTFRISIGTAVVDTEHDESPETMITRADEDMYIDKCTTKGNCKR
jgi:diguanylate cyclase